MKEGLNPRRITDTSSLNEISTEQLENRVVVRAGGGGALLFPSPTPFYSIKPMDRRRERFFSLLGYLPHGAADPQAIDKLTEEKSNFEVLVNI